MVPDAPTDRAEAISYLGSSIKEYSPERTWPNLRGHPPRFERGPELDIPNELELPHTGIRITVPSNNADLYRIAPLAYYLGARVEIGETAALHLPNGYSEPLTTTRHSLEERVTRIVAKCFLLDVIARQDGYVPLPYASGEAVSQHLSFIPEALAEESLTTQLMEYLEAPTDPVLDALPRWTSTAYLRPHAEDIIFIPYLLDSMARIYVADTPPTTAEARTRAPSRPYSVAYSHPAVPSGGVSLSTAGFENRLASGVPQIDDAVVEFVTSDPGYAAELRAGLADAPFRDRADSIDVIENPSTATLHALFSSTADLLILDLPASGGVFSCTDGRFDLDTLPNIRPRAIVIDSAHTDSGTLRALVEAGGVNALAAPSVTTSDVGLRLLGSLLAGHTFSSASELVFPDATYLIAGAPLGEVLRVESGESASSFFIERSADGYDVTVDTLPTAFADPGSMYSWPEYFYEPGSHLRGSLFQPSESLSLEDVAKIFQIPNAVVILDDDVYAHEMDVTERFDGEIPRPLEPTLGINRIE